MMKTLVITAWLTIGLAYYLTGLVSYYPDGLENNSTTRQTVETFIRIMFRIGVAAERVGICDSATIPRKLMSAVKAQQSIDEFGFPVEQKTMGGVPVLIFRPKSDAKNQPAIVYYHGGGFVLGSARSYSPWTALLAKQSGVTIISVDYRLAPEHPYPAALEDCLTVTKLAFDQAEELGIDKTRIAVAGDSAGGNLAAVVATKLAGSEKYNLRAQMLFSAVVLPHGTLPLPSAIRYRAMYPCK